MPRYQTRNCRTRDFNMNENSKGGLRNMSRKKSTPQQKTSVVGSVETSQSPTIGKNSALFLARMPRNSGFWIRNSAMTMILKRRIVKQLVRLKKKVYQYEILSGMIQAAIRACSSLFLRALFIPPHR